MNEILSFATSKPLIFGILALGLIVILMILFVIFTVKQIKKAIKTMIMVIVLIIGIALYFLFPYLVPEDYLNTNKICVEHPDSIGCWICKHQEDYSLEAECQSCNKNFESQLIGENEYIDCTMKIINREDNRKIQLSDNEIEDLLNL